MARAPDISFLICLLAVGISGRTANKSDVFHDGGDFSAIPNATAIEALKNFTNSPIVPFYEALRELYLTNGFDKHVLFNGVILGQTIIPDFQWKELVRALENSFGDVKNGDVYFRRIKGMIKMNEPDALILEPWLINLVSMILEKSENSKNVAYSIRDLGVHLIDTGYPRVNYPNGTILRKAINEWTSLELSNEPYRANWTEPLLILHHTIGPENFNLIGDILEAQPWKTKSGMCFKDSEYFKNYKLRLNAAISNADIGFKLLSGIRNAFENATAAAKEDTLLNFLVHADLNDLSNVPVSDKEDRNSRSNAEMSKIWSEINNEQAKTKFVEAMKSSGIGELEKAKNAFIAGARLIKNLGGSVENANKKCEEVVKLNEVFPSAHESLNSAIQILLKLNETESAQGRPGYKYLFDMYFEGNTLGNIQLFSSSRFQNRYYMLQLFDTIQKSVADELLPIIQYIISQRMSLSKFRTNVEKLNNDLSLMTALPMYFGRFFAKSPPRAVQIREVLRNINGLSRTDEDLMDYAKSIAAILKTNNINNMIQLTKLSRDGLWLDVYDSLVYVFTMSAGPSDTFKGLESMIGTTGSYQEVFLAMQTILESPETSHLTCKFIKEFFTGLEDATSVVEAFGVNTGEIRRQNEVTTFVNALIQLLKASESREALGRMIAFHGAFTTNPNATISALHIADMLEYFGATGWN